MNRFHVLTVVSSVSASVPGLASAQSVPLRGVATAVGPGGVDQIDFKNGGLLRGTIVALDPGKEVVILIEGTGDQRRVPWNRVARVNHGKDTGPSAPLPQPSMPQPSAETILRPVDGAPRVHIQSDPGTQLYEVTSSPVGESTTFVVGAEGVPEGSMMRPVCMAPCNRIVDGRSGQFFLFAREGTTSSPAFQLVGRGPEVAIDVKSGSQGKRGGGVAMLGLGGAAIAAGGAMLFLGAHPLSLNPTTTPNSGLMAGGGVLVGAAVGLVVGVSCSC